MLMSARRRGKGLLLLGVRTADQAHLKRHSFHADSSSFNDLSQLVSVCLLVLTSSKQSNKKCITKLLQAATM